MAAITMADRRAAVAQQEAVRASRSLMAYELQMDYQWEDAVGASLKRDGAGVDLSAAECGWLAGAILGMTRAVLREWFAASGERDLVAMGGRAIGRLELGFGLRASRGE